MPTPDWITRTDQLNFSTVKLETYRQATKIGDATGFFVSGTFNDQPHFWLATNWHVVTGRNAENPELILHSQGAIPDRIKLSICLKPDQPEYAGDMNQMKSQNLEIELFDNSGRALWQQHPKKNSYDIAIISTRFGGLDRFHVVGVNENEQDDMPVEIGNEVFILGFPLGLTHLPNMPIWKSGTIATDPTFETPVTGDRVVIDATTRSGMSGAPVIMRAKTHYFTTEGELKVHRNATRWIGIYSSRPGLPPANFVVDEDRRAEVGYFIKPKGVFEAIRNGIRGPDYEAMP